MTSKATQPPGDAQEDWRILRALSDLLGARINFDSLEELRASMGNDHKLLNLHGATAKLLKSTRCDLPLFGKVGEISSKPFILPIEDYYMTNSICASSPTMAKCSKNFNTREEEIA